jgi:hypothetical protein
MDTKEAAAAKALIDDLKTPDAVSVIKSKGMTRVRAITWLVGQRGQFAATECIA